jgi:uncharacterized protein
LPGRAVARIVARHDLVFSPETLAEFAETLEYPRIARLVAPSIRAAYLGRLEEISIMVVPSERIAACRDPRDDKWLELAASGDAKALVTGDQDLLALHPFRDVAILSPRRFLAHVAER